MSIDKSAGLDRVGRTDDGSFKYSEHRDLTDQLKMRDQMRCILKSTKEKLWGSKTYRWEFNIVAWAAGNLLVVLTVKFIRRREEFNQPRNSHEGIVHKASTE